MHLLDLARKPLGYFAWLACLLFHLAGVFSVFQTPTGIWNPIFLDQCIQFSVVYWVIFLSSTEKTILPFTLSSEIVPVHGWVIFLWHKAAFCLFSVGWTDSLIPTFNIFHSLLRSFDHFFLSRWLHLAYVSHLWPWNFTELFRETSSLILLINCATFVVQIIVLSFSVKIFVNSHLWILYSSLAQ